MLLPLSLAIEFFIIYPLLNRFRREALKGNSPMACCHRQRDTKGLKFYDVLAAFVARL